MERTRRELTSFSRKSKGRRTVAIGISDKHRRIEGVDYYVERLNDLLRTPIDFCNPTIPVTTEMKKANVIVAVTGQGKGKYILSISQEI